MLLTDAKILPWEEPPRGYYLTAVKQKVLWEDKETGATTVLLRFPPGVADKVHSHPAANQHVYGIRGEIEGEDGERSRIEGIYAHFPKGEEHGGSKFTEESVFLFHWDGSPTPTPRQWSCQRHLIALLFRHERASHLP